MSSATDCAQGLISPRASAGGAGAAGRDLRGRIEKRAQGLRERGRKIVAVIAPGDVAWDEPIGHGVEGHARIGSRQQEAAAGGDGFEIGVGEIAVHVGRDINIGRWRAGRRLRHGAATLRTARAASRPAALTRASISGRKGPSPRMMKSAPSGVAARTASAASMNSRQPFIGLEPAEKQDGRALVTAVAGSSARRLLFGPQRASQPFSRTDQGVPGRNSLRQHGGGVAAVLARNDMGEGRAKQPAEERQAPARDLAMVRHHAKKSEDDLVAGAGEQGRREAAWRRWHR